MAFDGEDRRIADRQPLDTCNIIISGLKTSFEETRVIIEEVRDNLHIMDKNNAVVSNDLTALKDTVKEHNDILHGNGKDGLIITGKLTADTVQDIKKTLNKMVWLVIGAIVSAVGSMIVGTVMIVVNVFMNR